jgi:predicted site-specific integrase-resolvase
MKLSEYARRMGVSYKTAWRWWRAGRLDAYQAATGTIIVREPAPLAAAHLPTAERVTVSARVAAAENRPNLAGQAHRLVAYCAAKGYQMHQVVKEVGAGINESRPQCLTLLADPSIAVIVLEHQDRATRFGFCPRATLQERHGRRVEVVKLADNGREDVVADRVAIVSSSCARLYGQRRAKRTTETSVRELTGQDALVGEAPVAQAREQQEVAEDAPR